MVRDIPFLEEDKKVIKMFIPKKFFENNLKNLEGDAIKLYLYRIYFGQDEINQLSKELKMNENKVYKYIEKLNKQNLWDNVLVIQNYLDDIEFPHFFCREECEISPRTKEWISAMSMQKWQDLKSIAIPKNESLILNISTMWNHCLSAEQLLLILYCSERLSLSTEVIEYIFITFGKNTKIEQLEALAIVCADFELNDADTIARYYTHYHLYNKAITQIIFRQLSYKDKRFVADWCIHKRYDLEVVVFACLYAKCCIGKFAFPYIDKILTNWAIQGCYEIDDIIRSKQIRNISFAEQCAMQDHAEELSRSTKNFFCENLK